MTYRQAIQGFPIRVKCRSMKQLSQLTHIVAIPAGSREVTVALNCSSESVYNSQCSSLLNRGVRRSCDAEKTEIKF
jgi:hypothetical protein